MRLDVVTIFPEYLSPLDLSLIGKARRDGLLDVRVHDLRAFAHDRHRTVDDTPYGGGAGMVMKPEPWAEALDSVAASGDSSSVPLLIVPGPGGEPFTQAMAAQLSAQPWLVFACGRYEGIDERVYEHAAARMPVRVVSLGDYVLNGGEVAVLAIIEAVARLLPGVIGNAESLVQESHTDGLLEYPVYTKPAVWQDGSVAREVPQVLRSGDHAAIAAWQRQKQLERTAARRPDLLPVAATVTDLDGLTLGPGVPADRAEWLVLQRASWLSEGRLHDTFAIPPLDETPEDVAAWWPLWSVWTVRDPQTGRLVGGFRTRVAPDDPTLLQIGRLMLAPDLHGRGLGRALLAAAEATAPTGVETFWLDTGPRSERNRRMYRKAGYRPAAKRYESPTVELTKPRRPGALR